MESFFRRFGQLSTELSVVLFGLFFARLDSEKSIFRIMYLTIPISLIYTSIQVKKSSHINLDSNIFSDMIILFGKGFLELLYPDKHYIVYVDDDHYFDLYGHGGMVTRMNLVIKLRNILEIDFSFLDFLVYFKFNLFSSKLKYIIFFFLSETVIK